MHHSPRTMRNLFWGAVIPAVLLLCTLSLFTATAGGR